MNNKYQFAIGGAAIILVLLVFNNFFNTIKTSGNSETLEESIKSLKRNNALSKIGLQQNNSSLDDIAKLQTAVHKLEKLDSIKFTYDDIKKKSKRISKIYEMDSRKMHRHFAEIEKLQSQIKSWKRTHGVLISDIENIKPQLAISLSVLLDRSIEDAVTIRDSQIELNSKDWYYIKTFSESGDVAKLMSQGLLNSDYVNLANLSLVYSNKPQIIYSTDDKVKGIPSSEPPVVVIDEDDDLVD